MKTKLALLITLCAFLLIACQNKNIDIINDNTPTDSGNIITPSPTTEHTPTPSNTVTPQPTEAPSVEPTIEPKDPVSPSETPQTTVRPTTDPTKVPSKDNLLDQLLSYKLLIDDEEYQLPFSLGKLISKGWTISNETDQSYISGSSLAPLGEAYINLIKGSKNLYIGIINGSTVKSADLNDFLVYQIHGDISLPGGVTNGTSLDEVLRLYGTPKKMKKVKNSWVQLPYIESVIDYNQNSYISQGIRLLSECNKITSIELSNLNIKLEDYVVAPDNSFPYHKPDGLGTDIMNFAFKLEQQYYMLPAPLKEFTNNGFLIKGILNTEIAGAESYALENLAPAGTALAPENTISLVLEKGKSIFVVDLRNEYDTFQTYRECTVIKVRFLTLKKGITATLSGNVKVGSTEQELLKALEKYPYAKYSRHQLENFLQVYTYLDGEVRSRYEAYVFTEPLSDVSKQQAYIGKISYDIVDGIVKEISFSHLNRGELGSVNSLDIISPSDSNENPFSFTNEEFIDFLCYSDKEYHYWQELNNVMIFKKNGYFNAYDAGAGNPWLLLYGDTVDGEASFTVDTTKNLIIVQDYERVINLHYTILSSFEMKIRVEGEKQDYYFYKR
jgi:hypothetical protein